MVTAVWWTWLITSLSSAQMICTSNQLLSQSAVRWRSWLFLNGRSGIHLGHSKELRLDPTRFLAGFGRSMHGLESLNLHLVFAITVEASDYHPSSQSGCSSVYDSCHSEGFRGNCLPLPCPWDYCWKSPQHLAVRLQKGRKLYWCFPVNST